MKKTKLKRSVNYQPRNACDWKDIYKYLMNKTQCCKNAWIYKENVNCTGVGAVMFWWIFQYKSYIHVYSTTLEHSNAY